MKEIIIIAICAYTSPKINEYKIYKMNKEIAALEQSIQRKDSVIEKYLANEKAKYELVYTKNQEFIAKYHKK